MRFCIKLGLILFSLSLLSNCSTKLPAEINEAKEQEALGKYKRAQQILLAAEKKYPKKAIFPLYLGQLYERRFNELFKYKAKAITINDPKFRPLGEAVMMRNRKKEIIGFMLRDFSPAIKPFLRAIQKNRETSEAYLAAARLYAYMGKYNASTELLKRGINHISGDHRLPHLLADIYEHQKKYKPAIKYYRMAAKINPKFSATHMNMGLTLFRIKNYPAAIKAMEQVLSLNDNKKNSRNALRYIFRYFRKNRLYKEAVKWGLKHIEIIKQYPSRLVSLGKALFISGDSKRAEKYLKLAHKNNKKDHQTYAILGQIMVMKKKYRQAEKLFAKSLLIKTSVQVLFQLGNLHLEKFSSPARATKYLKKVLKLSPNHYPALFQLGLAYGKIGIPTTVQLDTWRKYIALAQNVPAEKEYLKLAKKMVKALVNKKR